VQGTTTGCIRIASLEYLSRIPLPSPQHAICFHKVVGQFVPVLLTTIDFYLFMIFGVCCIGMALYVYLVVPETKVRASSLFTRVYLCKKTVGLITVLLFFLLSKCRWKLSKACLTREKYQRITGEVPHSRGSGPPYWA
jgi:hypothetical protein